MRFELNSDSFENFVDAVCIINSDLKCNYFNPSFANLVEESSYRAILKRPINKMIEIPGFDWDQVRLAFKEPTEAPLRELEFRTKTRVGKVQFSWKSIKDVNGNWNLLFYFRDVSLEEMLARKYREEISKKEDTIKILDQHLFQISLIRDVLERTNTFDDPQVMLKNLHDHIMTMMNLDFAIHIIEESAYGALTMQVYSEAQGMIRSHVRGIGENIKSQLGQGVKFGEVAGGYHWHAFEFAAENQLKKFFVFGKSTALAQEDLNLLQTMCEPLSFSLDNRELFKKAMTDEMTGLYNHRYFKVRLENELKEHLVRKQSLGLVLLDIDHFKKVNDSYGHLVGDVVLKAVAQCMRGKCRSTDVAARYGGEEFAVIFPEVGITELTMLAERIRSAIESLAVSTEEFGDLRVTASLGLAIFPEHAKSVQTMIAAADEALYQAKREGRNRIILVTRTSEAA